MPIGFHLLLKVITKGPIPIPQQITRRTVPRKGIAQLLPRPLRCGMSRDAKLQNAPTVVCQHQEHLEHLKPKRRHGEKVYGNHALHMVFHECSPTL